MQRLHHRIFKLLALDLRWQEELDTDIKAILQIKLEKCWWCKCRR